MKLADFPLVDRLIATREHIIEQKRSRAFRVLVGGVEDADLVERIRHNIVTELDRRQLEIEQQLKQLGVTVE